MPVLVVLTSMATMLEKPFGRYQFVKRIANALRGACTPRCRDERRKTASDVRRAATKIAKGNVLPIVGLRASAAPPEICQHTCTCCSTTQHISAVVSASELPAASELLGATRTQCARQLQCVLYTRDEAGASRRSAMADLLQASRRKRRQR
ncbi:hypothetical protein Pcac1_g24369 [Phytophthora cactorum]|nr:hypothetical protein Pcac1_g24369 [Phytophthora cactorum]